MTLKNIKRGLVERVSKNFGAIFYLLAREGLVWNDLRKMQQTGREGVDGLVARFVSDK